MAGSANLQQMASFLAAMQGGGETNAQGLAREAIERFEATLLSRSFLHVGTEYRPITRSIRSHCVTRTVIELDVTILVSLNAVEFDELTYILFRIRPDTKVSTL